MTLRLTLLALMAATPALAGNKPIHSLVIHSDENRLNCNDGFFWSAVENKCMPDNSR